MRKLILKDLLSTARIIKKAKLKNQLVEIMQNAKENNANHEKVGIEVVMTVIEACGDTEVESELYKMLGDILEKDNVESLSLESLWISMQQLAKENNLFDFFKSASQLNL